MSTSKSLDVIIDMKPKPCPRPRVAMRGKYPTAYYPKAYSDWKAEFLVKIREQVPESDDPMFEGNVRVCLTLHIKRPKTTNRVCPPYDIDNYAKSVLDGITSHKCIWKDDDQVSRLKVIKEYAETDRILIHIEDDDDEN